MGALSKAATYTRFFTEGEVPDNMAGKFERAIEARRFVPISGRGEDLMSAGWVALESPFDDELAITRDLFVFGELVALGYREDKIAVPKPLFMHLVVKRLRELEQAGETIDRQVRQAVQLSVMAELRRRVLPKPRIVDVVWDTTRGELRCFGSGTIVADRIVALFERTFSVTVRPSDYATRAFRLDLSSRARSVLETLTPAMLGDRPPPAYEDDA